MPKCQLVVETKNAVIFFVERCNHVLIDPLSIYQSESDISQGETHLRGETILTGRDAVLNA